MDPTYFSKYQSQYDTCRSFIDENVKGFGYMEDNSGRQLRLHTCFKNCKDYKYDDLKGVYTFDNRPNCTDTGIIEDSYMLCLYQDEECEFSKHYMEVAMGNMSLSLIKAVLAVMVAAPL